MTISRNKVLFSKNKKIKFFLGDRSLELNKILNGNLPFFLSDKKIVYAEQTHSSQIKFIEDNLNKKITKFPIVDAFITKSPNCFLMIKTADCFPVLFYDEENLVVAAIHSGREGTAKNIVGKTLEKMIDLGADPHKIKGIIGAGIAAENYEVDEETFTDFVQRTEVKQTQYQLDILKVIKNQVDKFIKNPKNIFCLNEDTFASKEYFSYRKNKTKKRQVVLIGISNE